MGWDIIGWWIGWDGMGNPWVLPRSFCLKGEGIRFTLGGRRRINPLAYRQRKVGQSGADSTACEDKAVGLNVPKTPAKSQWPTRDESARLYKAGLESRVPHMQTMCRYQPSRRWASMGLRLSLKKDWLVAECWSPSFPDTACMYSSRWTCLCPCCA